MKGLFLNNLYSVAPNLLIYVAGVIISGVTALASSNALIMSIHLAFSLLGIPLGSTLIWMQKNNFSKWNRLEIVFPIARKTIALSQYMTYAILMLFGAILSLPFIILSGNYSLLFNLFTTSFLAAGIFFPLAHKFADDKLQLILIGSIIVSVVTIEIFIAVIAKNFALAIVFQQITLLAFSIITLVCSYFISVRIYSKKDM